MLGISNGKTFTYGDEGEIRQKNWVFRLSLQFNLITCIYINGYYNTDQRQEQFYYKHPQEHIHPKKYTQIHTKLPLSSYLALLGSCKDSLHRGDRVIQLLQLHSVPQRSIRI